MLEEFSKTGQKPVAVGSSDSVSVNKSSAVGSSSYHFFIRVLLWEIWIF